eukprot:4087443-Prymnesium_polylepis.1
MVVAAPMGDGNGVAAEMRPRRVFTLFPCLCDCDLCTRNYNPRHVAQRTPQPTDSRPWTPHP